MKTDTESEVMLYAWQPKGHGQYSFFVAAESKEDAWEAVEKHISDDERVGNYESSGWGTDHYELTVFPVGTPTDNAND